MTDMMGIVIEALKNCSTKLRKSFKTAFIQVMILYMVIPRKINFTQMGRYSDSCEQRFRQLYEHDFDRMEFNTSLMWRNLGRGLRKAIAIDAGIFQRQGKRLRISGSSGRVAHRL